MPKDSLGFRILGAKINEVSQHDSPLASMPCGHLEVVIIGSASRIVNVLLVDDQQQLRNLLANLLKRDGFQVTEASSGEEALDLSRNRSGRIDILITDIDMEGMSGIDLYSHIRAERPGTAVLFISADVDRILESLPDCSVLEKPFNTAQFVARVAEVLSTS
jgi:DNA-binding response OmpR family regulator